MLVYIQLSSAIFSIFADYVSLKQQAFVTRARNLRLGLPTFLPVSVHTVYRVNSSLDSPFATSQPELFTRLLGFTPDPAAPVTRQSFLMYLFTAILSEVLLLPRATFARLVSVVDKFMRSLCAKVNTMSDDCKGSGRLT